MKREWPYGFGVADLPSELVVSRSVAKLQRLREGCLFGCYRMGRG